MSNDAGDARLKELFSSVINLKKTRIGIQNSKFSSLLIMIFFLTLVVALGLFFTTISINSIYAQVEIPTDKNITSSIFNRTIGEDTEPSPDILYSALKSDTIVGEVRNNFTYPIESVLITASVYDKNGVIAATGDTYTSDYQIKPKMKSGFDINLEKQLPSSSKYRLTTRFEKSEVEKPEALQLSVGKNSKDSKSFRVIGEVLNQGQDTANSVRVSGIFYEKNHKVLDVDYTYTNPDIISPNNKAPFEMSFYTNNPEKIKTVAINAQSDEYSLVTNSTQNETK